MAVLAAFRLHPLTVYGRVHCGLASFDASMLQVEFPFAFLSPFPPSACIERTSSNRPVAAITPNLTSSLSNLRPGGWVEFQDFDLHNYSQDNSIPPDNKVKEWYDTLLEGCDRIGRTASPGTQLETWARDAGFVNVHHKKFKLPLGPWPKDKTLVLHALCSPGKDQALCPVALWLIHYFTPTETSRRAEFVSASRRPRGSDASTLHESIGMVCRGNLCLPGRS